MISWPGRDARRRRAATLLPSARFASTRRSLAFCKRMPGSRMMDRFSASTFEMEGLPPAGCPIEKSRGTRGHLWRRIKLRQWKSEFDVSTKEVSLVISLVRVGSCFEFLTSLVVFWPKLRNASELSDWQQMLITDVPRSSSSSYCHTFEFSSPNKHTNNSNKSFNGVQVE